MVDHDRKNHVIKHQKGYRILCLQPCPALSLVDVSVFKDGNRGDYRCIQSARQPHASNASEASTSKAESEPFMGMGSTTANSMMDGTRWVLQPLN